jgi:hypothetical protein
VLPGKPAGKDHDGCEIHRHATGSGPTAAPDIVHEVLRGPGRPIPAGVRREAEARLGHSFADVRIHTDERAGASADAVAASAYTVGRHIVFARGRFDPSSAQGRTLIVHELTHAAAHPSGVPTPIGQLRVSTPADAAERNAVAVSEGSALPAVAPVAEPRLYRHGPGLVGLTGVSVNHDRVTVPPVGGLSFVATKAPANAPGVTFSIVGDNATIAAQTKIDSSAGVITVAPGQTGGSAHVAASQKATAPNGDTIESTSPATAPFNFTAIPSGIASTAAVAGSAAGVYGGEFTHTFRSPAGGQTALERSHVNEQFPAAGGTALVLSGKLGTLKITVNNPSSPSAGWDLNSSGTMAGPDNVTWSDTTDARPFVKNASNPTPADVLPQAWAATQNFRNLTFPTNTYGATAVASTTHRRAIEDRAGKLKGVTSANAAGINKEVVQDYAGPTVFRRCRATPASISVAGPAPSTGPAPAPQTSKIAVDAQGTAAIPQFSIRPPDLGCTITPDGEITPGTTAGTITVRAGDSRNYDETTVTLTPLPATPKPAGNRQHASAARGGLDEADRSWIRAFGFREWLRIIIADWKDLQARYAAATPATFRPTEALLMGILTASRSRTTVGEEQIRTKLKGDPAALKEFRDAYRNMIAVVVHKYALLTGKKARDVFQAHRKYIAEWALRPQPRWSLDADTSAG